MPKTLADALTLFNQSAACKNNPRLFSNVKAGLRIYVLPQLSLPSLTIELIEQNLESALRVIAISDFLQAKPEIILVQQLQAALKSGDIKPGTDKNYRSGVKRFFQYLESEDCLIEAEPATTIEISTEAFTPVAISSLMPHLPKGRNLDKARGERRCTGRNPYYLKVKQIPPKLTRQLEAAIYELKEEDFSPKLLMDLKKEYSSSPPNMGLHYFLTAPAIAQRKGTALRETTYQSGMKYVYGFLGWYENIWNGSDKQELSLELFANLTLLEEFLAWGISKLGNGYGWAYQVACSSLRVVKWLYHKCSQKSNYQDIPAIERSKNYVDELHKKYKCEGLRYNSAKNMEEKMMSFENCTEVVKRLKSYCAEKRVCDRGRRQESAIMACWQRYLIIAILTYCPIRQFEIRNLQFNVNLFREADGYWINWTPQQHKTGSKTGKGRNFPLILPEEIIADLDIWIQILQPRAKEICASVEEWLKFWLKPNDSIEKVQKYQKIWSEVSFEDNLLFFSMGSNPHRESFGKRWTDGHFHSLVAKAVYKLTGKRTSPHTFRNIGITHQRQNGDPEQRIALAEVMGHDPTTADKIYDQTTSRDRSKKAQGWWLS